MCDSVMGSEWVAWNRKNEYEIRTDDGAKLRARKM